MHPWFSTVGGSGGFFLACEDFGKNVPQFIPLCAFLFFKVGISSCTLIPLLRPGSVHNGSAN